MKNYFLFIVVFFLGIHLYSNPLPVPIVSISELEFRDNDKWFLELELLDFQSGQYPNGYLIIISGDTSILPWYSSGSRFNVIDISTLSLSINPLGDTIKIVAFGDYIGYYPGINELIFGNCEGAVIQAPKIGQSIALCNYFFVIDNSPTIGYENDNNGVFATMNGVVYDKNLLPVANRKFRVDIDFETDANGNYSTLVYARQSHFTSIYYGYYRPIPIDDIIFEVYPDSTIERDIYLLDTLQPSISEVEKKDNFPIRFFPNPLHVFGKLHYEIDLPILSGNMSLNIFSMEGKLLQSHRIIHSAGEIDMPQSVGIYRIALKMDEKIISTSSIAIE